MSEEHARLGGSTAARWLACAGSIRLSEGMPAEHGFPAGEGNVAHHLARLLLADDALAPHLDPYKFVGETFPEVEPTIPVTEDMIEPVMMYVKHVRQVMNWVSVWGVESKVTLEALGPPEPMFGTADFWGYDAKAQVLHIADLKYGQGVMVEVKENKQTRYYAIGVIMSKLDLLKQPVKTIIMTIVQPRKDHPEGFIRREEISFEELTRFTEQELMPGAWATQDPNAPLVVGEHCRFCPAQAVCPALAAASAEIAQDEFGFYSEGEIKKIPQLPVLIESESKQEVQIVRVPVPEALTNKQIGVILPKLEIIQSYIKAVKAHAESEIKSGRPIPGFKVVERRAHREWGDEALAAGEAMLVTDDPHIFEEPELKSPAQIEKLVGKKKFKEHLAQYTVKKSSGVVLVLDSDSRESKYLAPGEEFGVLPAPEPTDNEGENGENE